VGGLALLGVLGASCAQGSVEFEDSDSAGAGTAGETGEGGSGGDGGAGGGGGIVWPCGIDCSKITVPDCQQGICNEVTKKCEVVPAAKGTSCDDGKFCTLDDACDDEGVCQGGAPNDCGMAPPPCTVLECKEASQSCTTMPAAEGAPCVSLDKCVVNAKCSAGQCLGAQKDCFFAPVPDECHVAVCNPQTGTCDPQPGNEGLGCTDAADLCTVSKTCMAGVCQGGVPKDCSAKNAPCATGTCDVATGQCFGAPINDGDPCNDLNPCTSGEKCTMSMCSGGLPITQCVAGDNCCPAGCTEQTDVDCSCAVNLAPMATPLSSGGGQNGLGYGPINWNDGIKESQCVQSGCNKCFGWVSNGQTPSGAWVEYDWATPQQIGSIYVQTDHGVTPSCGTSGRNLKSGTVQWWDGVGWKTATMFDNQLDDVAITFSPKITTQKLRIFDVTTHPGNGNSLIFEWYVFPGSGCMPM
jgi:hypothetical protein